MRNGVLALLVCFVLSSCSTSGGVYDRNDPNNSEFSPIRTLFVGAAVVGVVYGASRSGGGSYENPKWDYLQANRQWACRNANNGQFLTTDKCANKPMVDNWPEN
jgi:hypothetical protein